MAASGDPDPVKVFVACLWRDREVFEGALELVEERWGAHDFRGQPVPFDVTDYYRQEMGTELQRTIVSFPVLILPDALAAAKCFTNSVEALSSSAKGRRVNLDVGYIDDHKIVLASGKKGGQKIYMGDGVWADMVARYAKGRYQAYPWSFTDFRDGRYERDFLRIREIYKACLKSTTPSVPSEPEAEENFGD